MKLCDYGCGQEAKYPFKNGKWCCEDHWTKCPTQRKKNSIQKKKERKDPNSKYNSIKYREKMSKNIKDAWKDPNSKFNSDSYRKKRSNIMIEFRKDPTSKYNSPSYKENLSDSMKEAHKNSDSKYNLDLYREKLSNSSKEAWNDPDSKLNSDLYRKNLSNTSKEAWNDPDSKLYLLKVTIEKINKKYPFFSKIEEMRYNPDKPLEEKEIQVHCKNRECENSKDKGGWFTPQHEVR